MGERTRAALAAAKARGTVLGGDCGYRPAVAPDARAAALARRVGAERTAHRLMLEIADIRDGGVGTLQGMAQELTARGVPTLRHGAAWTHTTVSRLLARVEA